MNSAWKSIETSIIYNRSELLKGKNEREKKAKRVDWMIEQMKNKTRPA